MSQRTKPETNPMPTTVARLNGEEAEILYAPEFVLKQIESLKRELSSLTSAHDKMANEHNARCQEVQRLSQTNFARMHRLTGAIEALENLQKTFNE